MKSVKLVINNCEVLIDKEDLTKISTKRWRLKKYHKNEKYRVVSVERPAIYMHRLIMDFPKNYQVDHINGNSLDNRKENLRICSIAENTKNREKYSTNSSGYKGVYFSKKNKKWISNIHFNYKTYYLGSFADKNEAAKAYNDAAIKYFGEFANLNIIKEII